MPSATNCPIELIDRSGASIEGSDKRRFIAVLFPPPVTSPGEQARAAIVLEHRKGGIHDKTK